ncbi:hypothetical protein V6M85_03060 [Sulfolobus tengchongensis]|uniref:Uncharacterized protein n=1 Tax=Sulfolobus tengchongensis TaxID=207809 RepID=A0AAX4L351_9CREN
MSTKQVSNTETLLDVATRIAISASKTDNRGEPMVDSTTINNLLSFLQSKRNVNELLVYIMRQMGRGEIDKQTGKLLLSNLKDKSTEEGLELLGYVKWIYETLTSKELKVNVNNLSNVKSFKDLVEILSK